MWILKWLPDWIFYVILLIGVVGYFATYLLKYIPLPFVSMYRLPIQLVSIVCIIIGTFMAGSIHDNESWQARVKEMQDKVVVVEQQSKVANDTINEKSRQKAVQIQQKTTIVTQYIESSLKKHDNECTIPPEFITAHNQSAEERR